jgi:hypothetical protein
MRLCHPSNLMRIGRRCVMPKSSHCCLYRFHFPQLQCRMFERHRTRFLAPCHHSSEGRLSCPILPNRLVTRACCRCGIHRSFPCSYGLLLPMALPDANGAAVYIVADNQRHLSTIFLMFQQCFRGSEKAKVNRGGSLTVPPLKLRGQQNSAAIGPLHEESLDCGGENL